MVKREITFTLHSHIDHDPSLISSSVIMYYLDGTFHPNIVEHCNLKPYQFPIYLVTAGETHRP